MIESLVLAHLGNTFVATRGLICWNNESFGIYLGFYSTNNIFIINLLFITYAQFMLFIKVFWVENFKREKWYVLKFKQQENYPLKKLLV